MQQGAKGVSSTNDNARRVQQGAKGVSSTKGRTIDNEIEGKTHGERRMRSRRMAGGSRQEAAGNRGGRHGGQGAEGALGKLTIT